MIENITSGLIEVRFSGGGIKPETVKASEVADILKSVESMVESRIFQDHPEIDREQVIIGLVNIKSTSLDLLFSSPIPEYTIPAFRELGKAVKSKDYSSLPSTSRNALSAIVTFTHKKQCTTELSVSNGHRDVLATITHDTIIEAVPLLIGDTTIYGKVVRVGGRIPKVMVETVDGQTVYCDAPVDITTKLGEKLYRVVGLSGTARWNPQTLVVEDFNIQGILPYEDLPLKDAISRLANIAGAYYADVHNVEKYISDIRA